MDSHTGTTTYSCLRDWPLIICVHVTRRYGCKVLKLRHQSERGGDNRIDQL